MKIIKPLLLIIGIVLILLGLYAFFSLYEQSNEVEIEGDERIPIHIIDYLIAVVPVVIGSMSIFISKKINKK